MCGIIGILLAESETVVSFTTTTTTTTTSSNNNNNESITTNDVNQMLFDGLTVLQHRGQDAAGIVTASCSTSSSSSSSSSSSTSSSSRSTDRDNKKWRLHLRKDNGLVKDVFQQHHMIELRGHVGLGHCRYPTAGSSSCSAEAQPLYTNYPYGICVAHNGNITNTDEIASYLHNQYDRHVNTDSDSELLLNLFAEQLTQQTRHMNTGSMKKTDESTATTTSTTLGDCSKTETNGKTTNTSTTTNNHHHHHSSSSSNNNNNIFMQNAIFAAMTQVMMKCHGGYAGLYLINGYGLVGFRDPNGIRPLVFGCRKAENGTMTTSVISTNTNRNHNNNNRIMNNISRNSSMTSIVDVLDEEGIPMTPKNMEHSSHQLDYCICSESVALDTLGFKLIRDVRAGEAIYIDMEGNCHSRMVHPKPDLSPCIFEYVYFARPDSIIDGVSVYETRLKMGEKLAQKILRTYPNHNIDVVIPIPDTSRTAALQAAYALNRPFREGFIKNRYIPRTFIMPGQAKRRKSIRLKLNTIKSEFAGKNVLLMDDSIVRGTTAHEIVQMARDAGAKKVFFSSAAPPIRYPNIYGIDIPTRTELMAYNRNEEEIATKIGCDWVIYQDLQDLEDAVTEVAPPDNNYLKKFDTSCFSGIYVTGETINDPYFTKLHEQRNDAAQEYVRKGGPTVLSDSHVEESPHKRDPWFASNSGSSNAAQHGSSCESMSNLDTVQTFTTTADRAGGGGDSACEPIVNDSRTN